MHPSKVEWLPALAVLRPRLALGSALLGRLRLSHGSAHPHAVAMRGFLWGTASVAVLGLSLLFVARAVKPQVEGNSVSDAAAPRAEGRPSVGTPAAESAADEAAARAVLARDPEDLEARLELARLYLDKLDFMAVWNETQHVLARSPGEPRALMYQSQVRLAMGQPDVALSMLKQATAKSPDLLQAYIYLSYVYLRVGRMEEAEAAMAAAKRQFPAQRAMLDRGFAEMQADLADESPMPLAAEGNPHARLGEDHEIPTLSGTVDLDPALKGQVAADSVVFLTVRDAGFGAGPPIAAKRLVAATFPLAFEIGAADSMRGDRLPAQILLEARVDRDGDPLTRDPSDPSARADDLAAGSKDVRLVLKRR